MADSTEKAIIQTQPISMEQMEKMFQMFQKLQKQPANTEKSPQPVRITEKLNYHNYKKWCKLIYLNISGRGRLNHIILAPVSSIDPKYSQWSQKHSMVIPWIIENIEADLVNQFLDYTTARDLWKGIKPSFVVGEMNFKSLI